LTCEGFFRLSFRSTSFTTSFSLSRLRLSLPLSFVKYGQPLSPSRSQENVNRPKFNIFLRGFPFSFSCKTIPFLLEIGVIHPTGQTCYAGIFFSFSSIAGLSNDEEEHKILPLRRPASSLYPSPSEEREETNFRFPSLPSC